MKPILQNKTVLTKRNEKSLNVWRRQTHVHVVILQVVAAVIAGLLLGVREHSEGLAHLLKLLLFLFLHFSTRSAMSVCERYKRDYATESGRKKTLGLSYTLVAPLLPTEQTSGEFADIDCIRRRRKHWFFQWNMYLGGASGLVYDRPFWFHLQWHF